MRKAQVSGENLGIGIKVDSRSVFLGNDNQKFSMIFFAHLFSKEL